MRPRLSSAVLLLLLTLLLLPACTLHRPLTHHAVAYNKTVEEAQNRMLFLNIIRASQRRPMYFTGIGSITASPSYSLSAGGGSVTDSKGGTDANEFALPGGSYSNEPTLQVGVLDTQDFTIGILSPVTADEVSHYLAQGWSTELLAYLLVERVEIHESSPWLEGLEDCNPQGAELVILNNDPTKPKDLCCFQRLIHKIRDEPLCRLRKTSHIGKPFLRVPLEPSLGELLAADQAGVVVQPVATAPTAASPSYNLSKRVTSWEFGCLGGDADGAGDTAEGSDTKLRPPSDAAAQVYVGVRSLEEAREDDPREPNDKLTTAFVFRSPQAILYYLGEIVRAIQPPGAPGPLEDIREEDIREEDIREEDIREEDIREEDHRIPFVRVTEFAEPVPLFWAVRAKDTSCSGVEVSVEYGGSTYLVPSQAGDGFSGRCRANGSMRSLTLVSQLLSLHKSAKDLPGTTLVRVVGD